MTDIIPGVHVAIHTHAEILHTAAWMDFSNYVRALLQQGRVVEARRLWDSVVEVIHNGTNPNLFGHSGDTGVAAGPMHGVTMCALRRTQGWISFSFLRDLVQFGLFWPELGKRQLRFGRDTMTVRSALSCWVCSGWRRALPETRSFQATCGGASFRPIAHDFEPFRLCWMPSFTMCPTLSKLQNLIR